MCNDNPEKITTPRKAKNRSNEDVGNDNPENITTPTRKAKNRSNEDTGNPTSNNQFQKEDNKGSRQGQAICARGM